MTWSDAKEDAKQRAELMLSRIRSSGGNVQEIRLVDYETEEDFEFLRVGEQWSHGYHKMVLRAIKRILRKEGYRVQVRTLNIRDYYDWLTKEKCKDCTEHRAAFISL